MAGEMHRVKGDGWFAEICLVNQARDTSFSRRFDMP